MLVLDLDLDFFVDPTAHWVDLEDLTRLDESDYTVWPVVEALRFLREQCGLSKPLPGWRIERHGQAFHEWSAAIDEEALSTPFSICHVDAHADLGSGESVWTRLMGEIMHLPVSERPKASKSLVTDGSYLAFALAAGWVDQLSYVYCDSGGEDVFPYFFENQDLSASSLQLVAVPPEVIAGSRFVGMEWIAETKTHSDPPIPFTASNWRQHQAIQEPDALVVCRSPNFTPPSADVLYEAICDEFLLPRLEADSHLGTMHRGEVFRKS